MRPSSSSPSQSPVTTANESHTSSLKSPLHAEEHPTQPHPESTSSSQALASPTPPVRSSRHSMSAIQSKLQPNSPTTPISTNSHISCLIPPEPAAPLRCDQPVKAPSQSGIVNTVSFPAKSRQSITPSFSFPGTSGPATTYEQARSNPAHSHCALITASSTESISICQQTPNVYINGLPPHCSEQDLFALARPFGDIKSVRTFTRHVSEKPTGYGFVLFNDIESAQRCIEGLRKHRSLHPSFSKQIHRIPGTEYAQQNVQSVDQDENTFKARMEKLKDVSSTNLYIEGLPLSTDEESLAALIVPYKIKSSRLFKTKLSNPPRIIAFVRLETRAAAEDTIECLHGRMVRGWNDPGCRISVRFADSAEQRELRRAERTLKNGDQSPSRLTIAQASLLSLRGQELQANIRDGAGCKPQRVANPRSDNKTAVNPAYDPGFLPTSHSLPSALCYTYRESPLLATSELPSTSEMDTLIQSIQNGYEDGLLDNRMRSLALDNEYLLTQQAQLRALASATILSPNPLPITLPRGHTQARNGFTPTEELILEAHAQHFHGQAQVAQSSPTFDPMSTLRQPSATALIGSASRGPLPAPGLVGKGKLYHDSLPRISEDEPHAMDHLARRFVPIPYEHQGVVGGCPSSVPAPASTLFVRPSSRAVSIVPPPPGYEEHGKRSKSNYERPERPDESKQTSCTTSSFNNRQSISAGGSKPRASLLQVSTHSNDISVINNDNNPSSVSRDKNTEIQHTYMYSHGDARRCAEEDKGSRFRSPPTAHAYTKKSPMLGEEHSTVKEGMKSPVVVSPALTYSSRTPSTLSPATPFFGSFTGSQDAFEVMTMDNEDMGERKLRRRVAKN